MSLRQFEIQKAVYEQLTGNTTLMNMIVGVFDDVPQGSAFPYVVIGEAQANDWSQDQCRGEETLFDVHVWQRPNQPGGAQGRALTKKIQRAVVDALDRVQIPIDDSYCVDLQYQNSTTMLDPDGVTRHGVVSFRLLTTY